MSEIPFFILGSKRGGTTLLRLMLNKHSQLAVPPESHFFIPLLKMFSPEQDLTADDVQKALEIILAYPRFEGWNMSKSELQQAVNNIEMPACLSLVIEAIFLFKIKRDTGKKRWGEKTPEYISIVKELCLLFPGAQYIALSRDGRDVSQSLKERGWEGWSVYQRAKYWQYSVRQLLLLKNMPVKSIFLRYEDLVLHQKETLSRLASFLNVRFEESMLNFDEDYEKNITSVEKQSGVHSKLKRKPSQNDAYRWKQQMKKSDVWKFESQCSAELKEMGYAVINFKKNNPLHIAAKYLYTLAGSISMFTYKLYHSILSKRRKEKLRNYHAYLWLRKLATKL
ncbi:MAG TPA: sulfotransferase [Chitinophagaceae bacterium]|nr:sulfotransferase [Chitinophagaceae bacterium]